MLAIASLAAGIDHVRQSVSPSVRQSVVSGSPGAILPDGVSALSAWSLWMACKIVKPVWSRSRTG
ncbi:hypothetical protein [Sinorhizobium meliloti]|uniref:hypothetical protein n=1 Tax=Rhizobium meliloti TaxID=382 RepID=UPI002D7974FC|nr:hypothetical protein [Sinorhizobium meliloti]